MGYQMKGSPAKMGTIQGTVSHASALKQKVIEKGTTTSKNPNADFTVAVGKASLKAGGTNVDIESLEKKRNQFYVDYQKEHGKTKRSEMARNMRNKDSKFYNKEFDYTQSMINDIFHKAQE